MNEASFFGYTNAVESVAVERGYAERIKISISAFDFFIIIDNKAFGIFFELTEKTCSATPSVVKRELYVHLQVVS